MNAYKQTEWNEDEDSHALKNQTGMWIPIIKKEKASKHSPTKV